MLGLLIGFRRLNHGASSMSWRQVPDIVRIDCATRWGRALRHGPILKNLLRLLVIREGAARAIAHDSS